MQVRFKQSIIAHFSHFTFKLPDFWPEFGLILEIARSGGDVAWSSQVSIKRDEFCITNDEFCIINDELCITNDEFCNKNDEFCNKMMNFCIKG